MPGQTNLLLAEARLHQGEVHELAEIKAEFAEADAADVIGADHVTNPAAKTVFLVTRGMACGYAGVTDGPFFRPNMMMLFGGAKEVTPRIVRSLQKPAAA